MKPMKIDNIHIDSAVEEILNTRDFGGDESQALRDFQADRKIKFSEIEKDVIAAQVAGTWRECQVAAGVKHILSDAEREHAFRDVENVEEKP